MKMIYAFCLGSALLLSSCMSARVVTRHHPDLEQKNPYPATTWFWGLRQPQDIPAHCVSKAICRVTAKTNFGYILLATVTLGIVVKQEIAWECCPPCSTIEDL